RPDRQLIVLNRQLLNMRYLLSICLLALFGNVANAQILARYQPTSGSLEKGITKTVLTIAENRDIFVMSVDNYVQEFGLVEMKLYFNAGDPQVLLYRPEPSPSAIKVDPNTSDNFDITRSEETRTVSGYNCVKYTGISNAGELTIWVDETKELPYWKYPGLQQFPLWSAFYAERLGGMPVLIEGVSPKGEKMKMELIGRFSNSPGAFASPLPADLPIYTAQEWMETFNTPETMGKKN
ncbi:MAG: hypothetical protein ACOCZ8_06235, partial [Bacteroidota bacterium]